MFGFLTRLKAKGRSSKTKGESLSSSSVGGGDHLKDTLVDPLQQQAQQSSTQSASLSKKKNDQPGLLHRLFKTKKWRTYQANKVAEEKELKMKQAYKVAATYKNSDIVDHHWGLLYKFAKTEFNTENMDFIEAVNRRESPESIYQNFVSKNGEKWINLPKKVQAPLDELANKGQYSRMDFGAAKTEALLCVNDTVQRFRFSPMHLEEIARGL